MTAPRFATLALALLLAPVARADQFMYLDLPTAQRALRLLHRGDVVHAYCAPCGETRSRRMTVRTLGIGRIWDRPGSARVYRDGDGDGFWSVEVNDRAIDLAYVYVRRDGRWHNLAMLAGAAPTGVPAQLPKPAIGTRWQCGDADDGNPYDTIFEQRRDPCPVDHRAREAAARREPGWH